MVSGVIMSDLQVINDCSWPVALMLTYEKLLNVAGTAEFESAVHTSVEKATRGVRRIYLFETFGPQRGELRYSSCEPAVEAMIPLYLARYMQKDPFHDACRAAPMPTNMALLRIEPRDVTVSGYRRNFFENAGIIERLSIVQRGNKAWRVMNVSRHRSLGKFCDREISSIVALASLLLPMMELNAIRKNATTASVVSAEQLEERFAWRFPELTRRERQVCARAALGMTVKSTALQLGIGKTTVLTFRQRAYLRLKVSSPYELSALVLN
jgi:DNA-binding CsgD family transcriptional regulator